jgi:arylsulfatase A-like enzyme
VGGEYYGYTLQLNPPDTETHGRAPADYSTDVFAAKAAEFVTTMPEPFFMTVSFFGPHDPYVPAPRHAGVPVDVTLNPAFNEADMSDKPALVSSRQRLDGQTWVAKRMEQKRDSVRAVLSVDEGIKRIVDSLVARGVYDNTVIVFMTDNGYSLGEHRWIGKRCQYEPCVRTPFMIRVPWLDGRTESRLVGNVDLASTFTELAGTKPTIEQDGRSIIRLLHDESIPWRTGLLLRSDDTAGDALRFWGLVTDRWKYVELEKGQRELYDLSVDPYELDNLSGKSAYASVMTSLAAELAALRG